MYRYLVAVLIALSFAACDNVLQNTNIVQDSNSENEIARSITGETDANNGTVYTISQSKYMSKIYNYNGSVDQVLLSFNAILSYANLAGGSHTLKVTVNNTTITEKYLVNKSQVRNDTGPDKYKYTFADGRTGQWFDPASSSWMTLYSNNFWRNDVAGSQYRIVGGEATSYEFNITPLLVVGNNTIKIQHNGNVSPSLKIGGLKVLERISTLLPGENTLSVGNPLSTTEFNVAEPGSTFIRFFARIEYPKLAGDNYCLNIYSSKGATEHFYDFESSNLMNKAQNANDYVGPAQYTYNDLRVVNFANGENFALFYSPDYTSNNLAGGKYGVIGRQAYQFDLSLNHHEVVSNCMLHFSNQSGSYNIMIKDVEFFRYKILN